MNAAACSLGDSVFVFCGHGGSAYEIDSVERINVPAIGNGGAAWELIYPPEEVFGYRRLAVVVPLNESEIVILGGKGDLKYDIVTFNVTNNECRKVADGGNY